MSKKSSVEKNNHRKALVKRFAAEQEKMLGAKVVVAPAAIRFCVDATWPGQVRQLRAAVVALAQLGLARALEHAPVSDVTVKLSVVVPAPVPSVTIGLEVVSVSLSLSVMVPVPVSVSRVDARELALLDAPDHGVLDRVIG